MTAAMLRDKLDGVASSAKGRIKIGTEKSRRWEFDDRIVTRPLTQATDQEDEVR